HPAGVISTKNSLLQRAKQDGLMTIQRVFMLDSAALDVSLTAVRKVRPDAVEVLPGVVPKLITQVDEALNIPIITGGFIQTADEVKACLDAGAISCSTSDPKLWTLDKASLTE
ncbi:MAG: glycerol-3-phosphate responsive antiterminator, partial [Eubacteriaceae bacterium]